MTAPRRVDPRVLPSETGWLLALLAATVLVNAWTMAAFLADPGGDGGPGTSPLNNLVMLLGPGLALHVMIGRARARRSVPLAETPFRDAAKVIGDLVDQAALTHPPQVRLDRKAGARGFVLGVVNNPYLILGPELLSLCGMGGQRRAVFEAVIRHELAHLRAGDLRWYTIATALRFTNAFSALWAVFAVTLSLAYDQATGGQVADSLMRLIGLVLLAELIGRTFLRVREHHADLRAAESGTAVLIAAVAGGSDVPAARQWLRRHPGGRARVAILEKSGVVFASGPGQLFLGAATAGVLLAALHRAVDDPALAGLTVGIPLAWFCALVVWRSAWHTVSTGDRTNPLAFAAALFTGLVIGSRLAPLGSTPAIPLSPTVLAAYAVGATVLCLWLHVLGMARARRDPGAARLDRFLYGAGLCVAFVGGWLFSTLAVGFTVTPWAVAAAAVVAGSLAAPRVLTRRSTLTTRLIAAAAVIATVVAMVLVTQWSAPKPAKIEIRAVDAGQDAADFACPTSEPGPADPKLPLTACSVDGKEKYALGPVELTSDDVVSVEPGVTETGGGELTVKFTEAGTQRWADLTGRHVGKQLAILAGGRVLTAPIVHEAMNTDTMVISGSWTVAEVRDLAKVINGM
ncbi:Peptidase family M48 [Actinokineospora alba]|uniref:Peptidase family M48 n=1 Tax=Actinokineospora alba TaxID=504798 RepID=A0A1H0N8Z5_9PSEU|nr:M48 family metalloprotease [Actinokineospora alba]TDP68624.1 peptidase M48-like protein [Actinokineospora alba]SDH83068.1 Peptidase family M48 [Actinokineospora alba]SDO89121.1 Peptidase family M48 [Actinokineospora alba]